MKKDTASTSVCVDATKHCIIWTQGMPICHTQQATLSKNKQTNNYLTKEQNALFPNIVCFETTSRRIMVPRHVKTNSVRNLVSMKMMVVAMMMVMMVVMMSSKSCHNQVGAVSTTTEEKLSAATSKDSIKIDPKGEEDPRQRRLSKKKKKEKKSKKDKKPKKPVRKPPLFGRKRDVIFPNTKPRVRREWRTLDLSERVKIANAMRMMKILTTDQGREIYKSDLFWNIDDMTILHACSTTDPRCDQGHYGPHVRFTLVSDFFFFVACSLHIDGADSRHYSRAMFLPMIHCPFFLTFFLFFI